MFDKQNFEQLLYQLRTYSMKVAAQGRTNEKRIPMVKSYINNLGGGGGGGGGGDMIIFENSPRKWPNSHSQKPFLRIFEKWQNSILFRIIKIFYNYQYL